MENDKKKKQIEEKIVRQRYLKTSPFNTINSNYEYTACVGTNGGYNQSTIYEGFIDAVDTLIKSIGEYNNYSDSLVYPILFCVRHSIELFLKDLYYSIQSIKNVKDNRDSFVKLIKAKRIELKLSDQYNKCKFIISNINETESDENINRIKKRQKMIQKRLTKIKGCIDSLYEETFKESEKEEFTHDLNQLIQKITKIYNVDIRIKKLFDLVLPLLSYYKDIDPNGDAFKYWSNKDGSPHFESKKISIVKIDIIEVQFEEITRQFGQIGRLMWYLRKEYNTGTFTKHLSREQLEEISKKLPLPIEFAEKIKEVKERVKKTYNIGSNEFDYALKIIRTHREFSLNMGKEKVFSCLRDNSIKIFVECSLGQRNWKESSSEISLEEFNLLYTFSDICGWRYSEQNYAYFSEDLQFLYSETKKGNEIACYNMNPSSEIDYVIKGMKKCGQITYATAMEGYLSKLKGQS